MIFQDFFIIHPAADEAFKTQTQPFLHSSQHTVACPLSMLRPVVHAITLDAKPLESFT